MAKAKIVIIDDEELSILGLKVLLEKIEPANQIVAQFTSSLRALEYLMNNPVDIVITDINMPKLNGLALIKKIREIDQSIQMIVLTGYGSLDYATEAMRYEVKFFLQKPCQLHELELAIQTSLEKIKVTKKNTLLFRKQKIDQVLLGEFVADKEVGPFLLLLYREYYYNDFHNKIASILYQQEIEYVISTINGMLAYFIFSEERVIGGLKKELLFNIQKKAIIYYSYHQNLERLTHSVLKRLRKLRLHILFSRISVYKRIRITRKRDASYFFFSASQMISTL
ncbi:MAG: response regulator [Enterococcus casseliflavus]